MFFLLPHLRKQIITALVTGVCLCVSMPQARANDASTTSSEALLSAEGNWNIIEESATNDPALAHQRARDKVDPRRRNVMRELSPHFTPGAKSGEDGKMRVLKMQPTDAGADAGSGLEIAETSIVKPTQKVVNADEANRAKERFSQKGVVKPAYKPVMTQEAAHAATPSAVRAENTQEQAHASAPAAAPQGEGLFDKIASALSQAAEPLERKAVQGTARQADYSDAGKQGSQPSPLQSSDQIISAPDADAPRDVAAVSPILQNRMELPRRTSLRGVILPPAMPPQRMPQQYAAQASRASVPVPTQKPQAAPVSAPRLPIKPEFKSVVVSTGSIAITSDTGAHDTIAVDAEQHGEVKTIGIRSAMHPSKTRIAFDFDGAVKYKVAIDHIRNVLRVKFDHTQWDLEQQGSMDHNTKLLGSYVVREQTDGSVIFEVRLRSKARIMDTMILRPGVSPHHRVVIDLKA